MRQYADSTLKKWTKEELIKAIRCLEETNDGLHEMNDRQFRLLMEKEIYAWHDLRKNPDDLPQKDGLYCVAVKYNAEIQTTGFGQWENVYGYESGWSALMPYYGEVIAWREIEPFEGVKE